MLTVRIGGPFVERRHINAVRACESDAINDYTRGTERGSNRRRRRANGSLAIGKQDDDLLRTGSGIKQLPCFGERVCMVGGTCRCQAVDRRLQSGYGCDQLGVLRRRAGKADHSNPAAASNLAVLAATGGLCKDVNEGIRTGLHAGQRNASHASGSIQHQDNIRRIFHNVWFCCERNRNFQRAITWDLAGADSFVRMNDAHIGSPPIGHKRPCHFMTKRGRMCNSRRRSPPAENVAPD